MSETTKIALDDADFASLKHFAQVNMGLEVKDGTNASQLRAKIRAANPAIAEIDKVDPAAAPVVPIGKIASATAEQTSAPAGGEAPRYSVNNPSADPKVSLTILKTADPTRSKDVTINVNGYVWMAQRGVRIDNVPYRVFGALNDAIEKRAVLSDRENNFGIPEYDYQDELSYPFQVHKMPSDEEIAAWQVATSGQDLQQAA